MSAATTVSTSLQYLVTFRNGRDYKSNSAENGEIPVIGSGGAFTTTSKHLYDGESVLFGRKGTLDRPLHVTGKFWTVDTMYYTELQDGVHGRWLYYWATTIPFDLYSTNTAVPSMTSSVLGRLPVEVPDFEEQRRIADFLDRETAEIDAMDVDLNRLIEALQERREATIRTSIGSLQRSGAGQASLQAVALLHSGVGFPLDDQGKSGLDFPFYKVNALGRADADGVVRFVDDTVDPETTERLRAKVLPSGSSILAKIGAALMLGRIRQVSQDACIDNNMMGAIPREGMDARFLYYHLHLLDMSALVNPSTIPFLNETALRMSKIHVPPLGEQRGIADRLDRETAEIDSMIDDARLLKEVLAERRSTLISDVVTGRKEVPA